MSATRRCPLYRFLNFFEEKIIIDKNLTIFYVNCDSLRLHFIENICTVLCLTLCNFSVFTFPINSVSITLICVSINFSKTLHSIQTIKGLTCRHLSNILLSSAISSSESLIKTVCTDCKTSVILFSQHSYRQSACVGSTAGSDLTFSASKSIF